MKKRRTIIIIAGIVAAVAVAFVIRTIYLFTNYTGSSGDFYFSSDINAEFNEKTPSLSAQQLKKYTPEHKDCISDFYFNKLTDKERCVYNAVLYAADKQYTRLYIPSDYIDGNRQPDEIISYVSCDDPLFEHNFTSDGGVFTLYSMNFERGGKLYYFDLPHNSKEYHDKREQAYSAAKKIVEDMPADCDEEQEKAAYLYDYAASNIAYDRSEDYSYDTVPVYDALVDSKHKTVCDGFSDSVLMLYNLAGLNALSVEGASLDGTGHVVNMVDIGGKYYYADAASDSAAWELGVKGRFYYLMTDDMLDNYFAMKECFDKIGVPAVGEYPAQLAADVTVTDTSGKSVSEAADVLNKEGCVLIAFSSAVDKTAQDEFGRQLSGQVKDSLTVTRLNAITAYTFKENTKQAA